MLCLICLSIEKSKLELKLKENLDTQEFRPTTWIYVDLYIFWGLTFFKKKWNSRHARVISHYEEWSSRKRRTKRLKRTGN